MRERTLAAVVIALVACTWSGGVAAEGDVGLGTVVLVKDREVVFDLGTDHGVGAGDRVRLYRKVTVHHPVTGATIEDRFPIGEAKVSEVGKLLSIIKLKKKQFSEPPSVGDVVELLEGRGRAAATPPSAEPATAFDPEVTAASATTPAADAEDEALAAAFAAGAGQPPEVRQKQYFEFLLEFPNGRYAETVGREIAWLNAQRQVGERRAAEATGSPPAIQVFHDELTAVEVGDVLPVVIAVVPPERADGARLFVRARGERTYEASKLQREGRFYFRGRVPAELTASEGYFEYFVQVTDDEGATRDAVGGARAPKLVRVTAPAADTPEMLGRSVATVSFEYVSFDLRDKSDDSFILFEADFFYRIRTFLYGLRVGVGVFDGTGGDMEDTDDGKDMIIEAEDLAANYGYLEAEFEVVPIFHFMLRGLMGNHHRTRLGEAKGVYGLEGGVRVGEETKTNLVASAGIIRDVGYEARLALTIGVIERVPIFFEGVVTDFPVRESDLGLRLVLGTGYRFTDWLAILARGSWNARTINHMGFGGGATLQLSW